VPGEVDSGIGRFLLVMSKGPVDFAPLPVTVRTKPTLPGYPDDVVMDPQALPADLLITRSIPYPQVGNDVRPSVRLLNSVDRGSIPPGVVQRLVLGGGQIPIEGATNTGVLEVTEFRYGDATMTDQIKRIRDSLGAGKLVIDNSITDPGEITVVVGRDVIDHPPADLFGNPGSS